MKIKYLYTILYRGPDGQILRYATNSPELYLDELNRLRRAGREILGRFKDRM